MSVPHGAESEHETPLGMVPYLPSHNHGVAVPCQDFCPALEWERHIERHGNPYEEAGRLRAALNRATEEIVASGVAGTCSDCGKPEGSTATCENCIEARTGGHD